MDKDQEYHKLLNKVLDILKERKKWAEFLLPKTEKSLAVCHNDLNNLNIMKTTEKVYLIDYDYVGFNYIGYDIANLINETSIDYSPEGPPGFQLLKTYSPEKLNSIAQLYPGFYPELGEEVLRFMCVSNLYWAIWSLKREEFNVSKTFGII